MKTLKFIWELFIVIVKLTILTICVFVICYILMYLSYVLH